MSIRIGKYIFAFYITKVRSDNMTYEAARRKEREKK